MSLAPGDVARLSYGPLTVDGTPTDATVTLTVTAPAGAPTTPTVTHTGTGLYQADYLTSTAGTYTYRWTAAGTATDVEEGTFTVYTVGQTLCTVPEAKAQINKNATNTVDDDEVLAYCVAVTDIVEDFCGRILPVTRSRVVTATGPCLVLPDQWIVSVSNITGYVGATSYPWTASTLGYVGNYGYRLDPDNGLIYALGYSRFCGTYQVDYTAGMATVPPAINLAARLIVADLWLSQQGAAASGLPPVFGDDTVTYDGIPMPQGRRAYELLARYRRAPGVA